MENLELFPPQSENEKTQYLYLQKFLKAFASTQYKTSFLHLSQEALKKAMTDLKITVFASGNQQLVTFNDTIEVVEKAKQHVKN